MLRPVIAVVLLAFNVALVFANKSTCPGEFNQCSLHGACMKSHDGSFMCNCEWGWASDDCSKKLCPHGIDPSTVTKPDRAIRLKVNVRQGSLGGKLLLSFHRHTIEFAADASRMTSRECTAAFHGFRNFVDVSCEKISAEANNGGLYEITIKGYPTTDLIMNNLYYHNGNPPIKEFTCDTSQTTGSSDVECHFEDVSSSNLKEYVPCSNRGKCDDYAGKCHCNEGFYGENCDSNADHGNALEGIADGIYFSGSLAHLSTKREPSGDFNFITAKADRNRKDILTLDGLGNATLHQGSLKITSGDHIVETGDIHLHGGDLNMYEQSDLTLKDGTVLIESSSNALDKTALLHVKSVGTTSSTILQLDLEGTHDSTKLIKVAANNVPLFQIDAKGNVNVPEGSVNIGSGLFVKTGNLFLSEGNVVIGSGPDDGEPISNAGLTVKRGGVQIERSGLKISSGGLVVEDSGATIASHSPSKAVLSLESRNEGFQSSVLELHGKGGGDLIRGLDASGSPVFQVQRSGKTRVLRGGLEVEYGGLEVKSGGARVNSGGLRVDTGGIHIASGGLTIENEGFHIENGGLDVKNNVESAPVLNIEATSPNFSGSAFVVHNVNGRTDSILLEGKTSDLGRVWSVESTGRMESVSDIVTQSPGRIISGGDLVASGRTIFSNKKIEAAEVMTIPCTHSYVQIIDDASSSSSSNVATIDSSCGNVAGQLLFINNGDDDAITGPSIPSTIPPRSVAAFIFDGSAWQVVGSTAAAATSTASTTTTSSSSTDSPIETNNVESDVADGDMNFGDAKVTAKILQAAGQTATQVAVYSKGGTLSGSEKFTFHTDRGELSLPTLRAEELVGRVNMSSSELASVHIIGGEITDVNLQAKTALVSGEMHVASNVFIGAGLHVSGQVMGSGAYVDTSDRRFKMSINTLSDGLETLRKLRGVTYYFNTTAYPSKNFPKDLQVGFIADEVEEHLPTLVTQDEDGMKHLAYSRVAPVLVEGMKEQDVQIQELNRSLTMLREKTEGLEAQVKAMNTEMKKYARINELLLQHICSSDNNSAELCSMEDNIII